MVFKNIRYGQSKPWSDRSDLLFWCLDVSDWIQFIFFIFRHLKIIETCKTFWDFLDIWSEISEHIRFLDQISENIQFLDRISEIYIWWYDPIRSETFFFELSIVNSKFLVIWYSIQLKISDTDSDCTFSYSKFRIEADRIIRNDTLLPIYYSYILHFIFYGLYQWFFKDYFL